MRKIAIGLAALLLLSGCAQATEPAAESAATPSSAATSTEETEVAESEIQATEIEATETDEPDAQETIETSEVETSPSAIEVESQDAQSQEPTEEASEQPTESPAPAATATPTETATTASGITLAEVAQRDSQDECWVAIDGSVYDLTGWIRQHPGGRAAILSLCGTDGTAQFLGQHGGSASAATRLDGYYLAPLAG